MSISPKYISPFPETYDYFVDESIEFLDILAHASYKYTERAFIEKYSIEHGRLPSPKDLDDFKRKAFLGGEEPYLNSATNRLEVFVTNILEHGFALKQEDI